MAWYDWIGPAAATAGFAGGELGSQVAGSFDLPRKFIWNKLFGTESGSELLKNLFGIDPEGSLGQFGGTGLEMLLDPVNLLGGFGLGVAGKTLGAAGSRLAMRAAKRSNIASELGNVNRLRSMATKFVPSASAAEDAARLAGAAPSRLLPNPAIAAGSSARYADDVIDELPDALSLGGRDAMRTYRRVNPSVSEPIESLGLGYRTADGTFVYQKPTFARGSGGTLQRGGDVPSAPLLQNAAGEASAIPGIDELIASSRSIHPPRVSGGMPLPSMGELAGGGAAQREFFSGLPGSLQDGRHLLDMPLQEGLGFANRRASELRRALLQLENETLSPLENILARTPLGSY